MNCQDVYSRIGNYSPELLDTTVWYRYTHTEEFSYEENTYRIHSFYDGNQSLWLLKRL